MIPSLMGSPSKLKTLLDRLTSARAAKLDNLDAALSAISGGSVHTMVQITATGTWAVPSGVGLILVSGCGGGGGGCRNNGNWPSPGGGGGASAKQVPFFVTGGSDDMYFTVGAGGAGRTGSTGNGSNGGASYMDDGTSADAGKRFVTLPGGEGGRTSSEIGLGGGMDDDDDEGWMGKSTSAGLWPPFWGEHFLPGSSSNFYYGGGGLGAGSSTMLGRVSTLSGWPVNGGFSAFGAGGNTTNLDADGYGYGGGGGGNDGADAGDGADGFWLIEYWV